MSKSVEAIKSNKSPIFVDVFVDNGDAEALMALWSKSPYFADWTRYAQAKRQRIGIKFLGDATVMPRIALGDMERDIDSLPTDFDTVCADVKLDPSQYYYDFTSHPLSEAA